MTEVPDRFELIVPKAWFEVDFEPGKGGADDP
jgi:hypothetical protein